jgi:hypothetical protein
MYVILLAFDTTPPLVDDCESTVFPVVPNTRKDLGRSLSRERRYVYNRSFFGPELQHTGNTHRSTSACTNGDFI